MLKVDIPCNDMSRDEVAVHLNVLCPSMEDGVSSKMDTTEIVVVVQDWIVDGYVQIVVPLYSACMLERAKRGLFLLLHDMVISFQFLCNVIVYFLVMHAQILSMVWIKKCNNTPIIDKLAPSFPPHHLVDALIDRKVYQTEDLPSCTMYACKCMYVCMYGCVCMYVCVYVSMYVCMHACMHALCMYVRTYVSILPSPIQFFEFCAIVYLLVIVHCH